jgi:hypothetical protein
VRGRLEDLVPADEAAAAVGEERDETANEPALQLVPRQAAFAHPLLQHGTATTV